MTNLEFTQIFDPNGYVADGDAGSTDIADINIAIITPYASDGDGSKTVDIGGGNIGLTGAGEAATLDSLNMGSWGLKFDIGSFNVYNASGSNVTLTISGYTSFAWTQTSGGATGYGIQTTATAIAGQWTTINLTGFSNLGNLNVDFVDNTSLYFNRFNFQVYVLDSVSPVFQSAATSTDGSKVILTYNEALNATTAATNAFAVTVGGNNNAVTNVTVNGSTVELTLTTSITNGQTITVAYTDPTTGNDANAIQDAAGNDVFSLSATSVTNTVPNAAPTIANIPSTAQSVTAGQSAALADFTVADIDSNNLTVTLTATNGTIDGVTDSDINTAGIQLTGSASTINTALASTTFTATNAGAAIVGISVTDGNVTTTGTYNIAASWPISKTYTQQSSDTGIVLLDGTPVVGGSTFGAFSDSGGSWITFQNINASTGITLKVKDSNGSWTTVNTTTQWADNSPYDTVAAYAGALAGIGVDYAVEVDFSQQVEGSHTITWEARTSTGNYDSDYTVTINVPDTTPPVFQSAASNAEGTKVILTYDGALNATTAAAEAFVVSVGGSVNAVTAVTVNGSNVELTLTTAITNGQAITPTQPLAMMLTPFKMLWEMMYSAYLQPV